MSWWYNTGTANVTSGSATVTGSGTEWLRAAKPGQALLLEGSDRLHQIRAVPSDTEITLVMPFAEASVAGAAYEIVPIRGEVVEAYQAMLDLRLLSQQLIDAQVTASSLAAALEAGLVQDVAALDTEVTALQALAQTLGTSKVGKDGSNTISAQNTFDGANTFSAVNTVTGRLLVPNRAAGDNGGDAANTAFVAAAFANMDVLRAVHFVNGFADGFRSSTTTGSITGAATFTAKKMDSSFLIFSICEWQTRHDNAGADALAVLEPGVFSDAIGQYVPLHSSRLGIQNSAPSATFSGADVNLIDSTFTNAALIGSQYTRPDGTVVVRYRGRSVFTDVRIDVFNARMVVLECNPSLGAS